MSSAALSYVAVAFVLGSLAALISFCLVMLRRAEARLSALSSQVRRRDRAASITVDEIIDLHLALKDINSLREISEKIPA